MTTEDVDLVHHALSGQLMQLAQVAGHAAELAVAMATRRSLQAEQRSALDGAAAADRLRADRELAAVVWARSRSRRWMAAAGPDELVTVWASARPWAAHDQRAARTVEAVGRRVAGYGVDVDRVISALDQQDVAELGRLLRSGIPEQGSTGGAGGSLSTERRARILEVLRGEWADSTVEAVAAGGAFEALAHKLSWLEEQGHDVAAVVRSLPEATIVGPKIRQPAAYAAWLVDRYAAEGAPVRLAAEAITEPAAEAVARSSGTPDEARAGQSAVATATRSAGAVREA